MKYEKERFHTSEETEKEKDAGNKRVATEIYTAEKVGLAFDGTVALVNGQPVIETAEGSTVEINGEELSVTFGGTYVIVNGEAVIVSETVGGGTASTVVEAESVYVNGESASVIFDGTTAIVNGEVVTASEEGSTVTINGRAVSVTSVGSDVVVNGDAVSFLAPSSAVLNGEVVDEVAAVVAGEVNVEVVSEAVISEAILPASVDVNGVGGKAKMSGGLSGLSTGGGIIDEQVTFIPRSEEYHIKDPEHGNCERKVICSSSCPNVMPSWRRVHHCYERMVKGNIARREDYPIPEDNNTITKSSNRHGFIILDRDCVDSIVEKSLNDVLLSDGILKEGMIGKKVKLYFGCKAWEGYSR